MVVPKQRCRLYFIEFGSTSDDHSIILALRLKNCSTSWKDVNHVGEKTNLLEFDLDISPSNIPILLNNSISSLTGLFNIGYLSLAFIFITKEINIEEILPFQNTSMLNIGNLEIVCVTAANEKTMSYCPPGIVNYQPSQLIKLFPHLQTLSLAGVYSSDNKTKLQFPWDEQLLSLPLNLSHFQFNSTQSCKNKNQIATSFDFTRSLTVSYTVRLNITNFCFYTKFLKTVVFASNELHYIPFNCFTPTGSEISELETLDLTNNRLGHFQNNTFKRLTNMEMLLIADCRLTYLQVGLFDDLVKLKVLDLNHNNITFLPSGIFSKLGCLEKLYVHNNSIQHIEYQSFPTYSDNLAFIDLRWNDLHILPYDCLTLPNLYQCDCKGNNISLNNLKNIIEHFDPIRMQLIELYGHSYTSNRLGTMHEVGQSTIDLSDNEISGIDYSHAWPK